MSRRGDEYEADVWLDERREEEAIRESRRREGLPPEGYELVLDRSVCISAADAAYDVRYRRDYVAWGASREDAIAQAWRHADEVRR